MQVTFYSLSKRKNSTKRPTASGNTQTVVLKDNCSILSPSLEINWGNNDPSAYNYCYIPMWGRYYYITDWTFDGRNWIMSTVSDAMASFRGDIHNSTLYVLRSQSDYDLNVADNSYPATTDLTRAVSAPISIGFGGSDLGSGRFIMGAVSRDTNIISPTGVTYYVMSAASFNLFRNAIFIDLTSEMTTALKDVPAMMLCNPVSFITSIQWVPFVPSTVHADDLVLGYWIAPNLIGIDVASSLTWESTFDIVPPRPAADRGTWQKLPPFCRYYVYIPYFGIIELPAEIAAFHDFYGVITVSITTGRASLKIVPKILNQPVSPCITHSAQVGQGMDLAGMSTDLEKFAGGVAKTFVGGAEALAGKVEGFLDFAKGGIETAFSLSSPKSQYMGMAGGTTETWTNAHCVTEYYAPTDEDIAHRGRPLCRKKQLGTLSGFCQVSDGNINTEATPAEKQEIKAYLEGGFYLE